VKILDILNSPWAIVPDRLSEICEIYGTHLRGEKIDLKAVESVIGKPLDNSKMQDPSYEVINGVAVISADGVVAKKMNMFTRISGGISTEILGNKIREAQTDPAVDSIVLQIDSPGGTVDGTQEIADLIFSIRDGKPIVAYTDGMIASAAYWMASAAQGIFISGDTNPIGSIGVVATHVDYSESYKQAGIKVSEITAGKFKRIYSEYQPLSREGRRTIQDEVDYLYSVFVSNIARNRNVSVETVLKDMADGRIFLGTQAIGAGLVDGRMTLNELITRMSAGDMPGVGIKSAQSVGVPAVEKREEVETMTLQELEEKHAELYQQVFDLGSQAAVADMNAKIELARNEGAEGEVKRIQDVKAQSIPGHEKLVEEMMFDGKTTGPEAAVRILNAERTSRQSKMDAYLADGAEVGITDGAHQEVKTIKGKEDDADLPVEQRAEKEWNGNPEIRDEFVDLESYQAYLRAKKNGNLNKVR